MGSVPFPVSIDLELPSHLLILTSMAAGRQTQLLRIGCGVASGGGHVPRRYPGNPQGARRQTAFPCYGSRSVLSNCPVCASGRVKKVPGGRGRNEACEERKRVTEPNCCFRVGQVRLPEGMGRLFA
ncbi:hypothetical protein XELAEV_18041461mg [Xenopus laevis]|uniref:Uncharacterized protein n=1 Tax=Xenopus laevis TaxID=8355 RepID=A0A974H546_XENLA|nr:hypothetical protein XELAEV_18041461mg [Xenopus laevis]